MYLGEQTIERRPLRDSTSREDERKEGSSDLRLFRPLMLISKIKDLYHLIELTSSTKREGVVSRKKSLQVYTVVSVQVTVNHKHFSPIGEAQYITSL